MHTHIIAILYFFRNHMLWVLIGSILKRFLGVITVFAFIDIISKKIFQNIIIEPRHEISNNVACATGKGSDQPAHTPSLIRAFGGRSNVL